MHKRVSNSVVSLQSPPLPFTSIQNLSRSWQGAIQGQSGSHRAGSCSRVESSLSTYATYPVKYTAYTAPSRIIAAPEPAGACSLQKEPRTMHQDDGFYTLCRQLPCFDVSQLMLRGLKSPPLHSMSHTCLSTTSTLLSFESLFRPHWAKSLFRPH
jgi:hypothetical protein